MTKIDDSDAPLPEGSTIDLGALAAAGAERMTESLDSAADPQQSPDPPESVARKKVASKANAPVRTRKAEKELRNAVRRRQVVELRLSGCTFSEIGEALGISRQGATKLYRATVKGEYDIAAEEARELELLRCEGIIRRWWPALTNPDVVVADRATRHLLSTMRWKADLMGLRLTEVSMKEESRYQYPTDPEAWQLIEAFRRVGDRELPSASPQMTDNLD
jgi:hypothetical protein